MEILRYTAFSTTPEGGNPAGVVLDAAGMTEAQMQRVAAEVGYSESAFLVQDGRAHRLGVLGSEFKDVPYLDAFRDFQRARLALRTAFA